MGGEDIQPSRGRGLSCKLRWDRERSGTVGRCQRITFYLDAKGKYNYGRRGFLSQ